MRLSRSARVLVWLLPILAAGASVRAAEIQSSTEPAYKPGSAYKKSIAGSTTKIAGSRPRSYVKPKKETYKEHMASLSTHRFKNEGSSSFGRKAAGQTTASIGHKNVLKSAQPPSSRVHIQKHIGKPSAGMSRNQPLTSREFAFLGKLSETLQTNNPAMASQLNQIVAGQKQGRTLTKAEYDTLMDMSRQIDDGQASYQLHSIAEKRRETLY